MSLNKEYNLGSAQYQVMLWLRNHPIEWRSNQNMSKAMGIRHAFRFSGNDANLGHTLYSLIKLGLVEKRDREIMRTDPLGWGITRKAWIAEFRLIDTESTIKTTYLEWVTDQPESWHVVQEINGVRRDLGKNW